MEYLLDAFIEGFLSSVSRRINLGTESLTSVALYLRLLWEEAKRDCVRKHNRGPSDAPRGSSDLSYQ